MSVAGVVSDETVTLREHFEALLAVRDAHARELRADARDLREADLRAATLAREADRERTALALQNVDRQRSEDRRSDELWRETTNEARGQLKDQASTFVTRNEFEGQRRYDTAAQQTNASSIRQTRSVWIAGVGGVVGVIGLVVAGAALLIK